MWKDKAQPKEVQKGGGFRVHAGKPVLGLRAWPLGNLDELYMI